MNEYFYATIWSMNGSPISQNTVEALERAIEGVLRDVEERDDVRLLYTSKRAERRQEAS